MLGTAHVEKAPRAHPLAFPHNENEAARTVLSVNLTQRLDALRGAGAVRRKPATVARLPT